VWLFLFAGVTVSFAFFISRVTPFELIQSHSWRWTPLSTPVHIMLNSVYQADRPPCSSGGFQVLHVFQVFQRFHADFFSAFSGEVFPFWSMLTDARFDFSF